MTGGPRHLWAGDWEEDSEEAARARRGARSGTEVESAPEPDAPRVAAERRAPAPTPARRTASAAASRPSVNRPGVGSHGVPRPTEKRPRRRLSSSTRRVVVILSAILLIVVAGAFGLGQLLGPNRTTASPSPAQPAWLGVQMGVLPAGAVVLTGVDSGGPAARVGLHTGDVITQIEGRPVAAPVDVTEAVGALRVGDTVEIQALRGSRTLVVRPRLTAQGVGSP